MTHALSRRIKQFIIKLPIPRCSQLPPELLGTFYSNDGQQTLHFPMVTPGTQPLSNCVGSKEGPKVKRTKNSALALTCKRK